MEIKEFIQNFADQFDDMDATMLTPETNFHDLEDWSSLVALSVMAMIDEEYDVQIKADEMRNATTIQSLFDIVESYL